MLFVINALMLSAGFAGDTMSIAGSRMPKLFTALIGSILISTARTAIGWIMPGKDQGGADLLSLMR